MAANHTIEIKTTDAGAKALPGRYVPGTDNLLAAVMHAKGSWSLTHVPSGFACLFVDSRERALACGAWFWAKLSDEARAAFGRDDLPALMQADKRLRELISVPGQQLRKAEREQGIDRNNRLVPVNSNADFLAHAKVLETERSETASA
jgi:hypothetical protein